VKLVVGLGNPGPRYAGTRHNVGFRVAERFAADCRIALSEQRFAGRFGRGTLCDGEAAASLGVAVLEPQTSMNRSGESVSEAVAALSIDDFGRDLLIVLDDMDLPFGRLRIRPRGGAGGHRGLSDILQRLESRDVPRLRFGVGRPPEDAEAVDHVLQRFSAEEARRLPEHLERASRAVAAVLREGVSVAMNRFNPDLAREDRAGES